MQVDTYSSILCIPADIWSAAPYNVQSESSLAGIVNYDWSEYGAASRISADDRKVATVYINLV